MPSIRYASTLARIKAVLRHRAIYEIGADLQPAAPVGRPPAHPAYMLLLFATMARVTRSTVRVETDLLEPDLWFVVSHEVQATLRREGLDLPPPARKPPRWHHWRRFRDDHLTTDDGLARIQALHLPRAVALAHDLGLLRSDGPASLAHPSERRAIYGDGTIVRPMYRPPAPRQVEDADGNTVLRYVNPKTKELEEAPTKRFDSDAALHQGHAGPAVGHGYVAWHARSPEVYGRVMLHIGHIPKPGAEAATAVQLLRDIYRTVGSGIQIVIYDGAFRGTHLDHVMTQFGYLAIAKQPTFTDEDLATSQIVKNADGRRTPSMPLGTASHTTPGGECHHILAAINGAVAQIDLDDTGDPVVVGRPQRIGVKRARRKDGRFHFNIGYRLNCPLGDFETWMSPHARHNTDQRPEALRVFPEGDSETLRLKGLRSDAESVHSAYKRTLIVERSMSLGWRRGLVDYYTYAWYNNALAEHAARQALASNNVRILRRHI